MTDPGELFRFWLMHRYQEQGFSVPKLAAFLKLRPVTVGHWLRRRSAISTVYWQGIADFFGKGQPEAMLAEARQLWEQRENRRYYTLRGALAREKAADAARVHPETPLAAAAISDWLDAAKTPSRPRRSARRATGRKTRGTRPGA